MPDVPEIYQLTFEVAAIRLEVRDLELEQSFVRSDGAALAVNGGFFDQEGEAEGYVVSERRAVSSYDRALGGGVVVIDDGRARLYDGETFDVPDELPRFAIQAKPRLVVDGALNIRSDSGRRAARTALCLRDEGRLLVVVVAPADAERGFTLYELGERLVREGCEQALNLDGGPSTALETPSVRIAPRGPLRHVIEVYDTSE